MKNILMKIADGLFILCVLISTVVIYVTPLFIHGIMYALLGFLSIIMVENVYND